jgi:hypothetical protein
MMTPDLPSPSEPGEPDPALFAPLTTKENSVLSQHLTSGWYKQDAVYPPLSPVWRETSATLDDLHAAWNIAFDAEQCSRAACGSCGARGCDADLEKTVVRSLADGRVRTEWHCTDHAACADRFAPEAAAVLAAGGVS